MRRKLLRQVALCLLLQGCYSLSALAQDAYVVTSVTVINVGDGRLLYREAKTDSLLNGKRRIIDGYNTAYLDASFKNGFYDGEYHAYDRNVLVVDGTYKEGRPEGKFRYYDHFSKLQREKNYKNGKLDGAVKSFLSNGQIENETYFHNGVQDGKDLGYDSDGKLWQDHNYKNGKQVGRQYTHTTGSRDTEEVVYYNEAGVPDGNYSRVFTDTKKPLTLGQYKNGQREGRWMNFAESGDTLSIVTYHSGEANGWRILFNKATGRREKAYQMKDGMKDGIYQEYDASTGALKYKAVYQRDKLNGPERRHIVSGRLDYWETTTYVNGYANGTYEAHYTGNNRLYEVGQYKNGHRIGHWRRFAPDGNIDREWDE
jgi:antitoxin component YwqK of YwqJK toxin-antitoxin module